MAAVARRARAAAGSPLTAGADSTNCFAHVAGSPAPRGIKAGLGIQIALRTPGAVLLVNRLRTQQASRSGRYQKAISARLCKARQVCWRKQVTTDPLQDRAVNGILQPILYRSLPSGFAPPTAQLVESQITTATPARPIACRRFCAVNSADHRVASRASSLPLWYSACPTKLRAEIAWGLGNRYAYWEIHSA